MDANADPFMYFKVLLFELNETTYYFVSCTDYKSASDIVIGSLSKLVP